MKRLAIFAIIVAVLAVGAWLPLKKLGGTGNGGAVNSSTGEPLVIHFTGDVSGRLEPCGCFTGQYGGLTRLVGLAAEKPRHHFRFRHSTSMSATRLAAPRTITCTSIAT